MGKRAFARGRGGGGHIVPLLLLVFGAPQKPGSDRVKQAILVAHLTHFSIEFLHAVFIEGAFLFFFHTTVQKLKNNENHKSCASVTLARAITIFCSNKMTKENPWLT